MLGVVTAGQVGHNSCVDSVYLPMRITGRVRTDSQMFLNVLEFEYFIYVPLNVFEFIAMFLNVLENVIPKNSLVIIIRWR